MKWEAQATLNVRYSYITWIGRRGWDIYSKVRNIPGASHAKFLRVLFYLLPDYYYYYSCGLEGLLLTFFACLLAGIMATDLNAELLAEWMD